MMQSKEVNTEIRAAMIACAVCISGCSGQPLVANYAPTKAACCSAISELPYRPFLLGQEVAVNFSSDAPTYSFSGRLEHFAAFKVPDGFVPSAIQVKTYLSTDFLPNATALIPGFIFYDAKFEMLGTGKLNNILLAGEFWRGAAYSGNAVVLPETRYIIIVAGEGDGCVPPYRAENGRPYRIPAAALGNLSIRIFGDGPSK